MKELLKKQQKKRFSWSGALHQDRAEERAIKTVITMESTLLIHDALIFPEGK